MASLAGSGSATFADGQSGAASFYYPAGVAADGAPSAALFSGPAGVAVVGSSGDPLEVDVGNHCLRTISAATGLVGTTVGTGVATLNLFPQGVAVDAAGAAFVGDAAHEVRRLACPSPSPTPTSSAGTCVGSSPASPRPRPVPTPAPPACLVSNLAGFFACCWRSHPVAVWAACCPPQHWPGGIICRTSAC